MYFHTTIPPSKRPEGSDFEPIVVGSDRGNYIVQLHDDIGTNVVLTANRIFRSQHHWFSAVGRLEDNAIFRYYRQRSQRNHLKTTGIGKQIVQPSLAFASAVRIGLGFFSIRSFIRQIRWRCRSSHKIMKAVEDAVDQFCSRLNFQVVGIGQNDGTLHIGNLIRKNSLQSSFSSYWHEPGRRNRRSPVWKVHRAGSSPSIDPIDVKTKSGAVVAENGRFVHWSDWQLTVWVVGCILFPCSGPVGLEINVFQLLWQFKILWLHWLGGVQIILTILLSIFLTLFVFWWSFSFHVCRTSSRYSNSVSASYVICCGCFGRDCLSIPSEATSR
mmetsp:Transcript_24007/g.66526  ORF Transcript_24007/g.66526 Transcript_24007/m.66526 type:complete len:328 (+) Transcript_24007:1187-2170(+)